MSKRYDYRPDIKPTFRWLSTSILLAICLCLFSLNLNAHNAFTSFTRIDFNSDAKAFDLSLQMHAHELELLLSDLAERKLSFDNDNHADVVKRALNSLLSDHIKLKINGAAAMVSFIGFDQKKDTIFIYLEGQTDNRPQTIEFHNSVFFDRHPGQINSVMAVIDKNRKAGEVTIKSGPITLEF